MTDTISFSKYTGDAFNVAQNVLLGATLCSDIDGRICSGKIVELELYMGDRDRASHAWPNKKTPRNAVMFGPGGHAYVYFVYGMHNMFNVVIGEENQPHAVLIRALEPIDGIDVMQTRRGMDNIQNLCNGPAKLAAALGITVRHNGCDLTREDKIWLTPGTSAPKRIATGKRIGIDYAGADADLPWRFVIAGNKFISKPI
ncbi:MAG: DNA-3-methyladenine glycosylase [Rickettsiales bacterium]|jgi:DNA-3-methyladenine glycosylase|nr:DNA-3-methyladenine glycosylase [Rickettsiales bacterium]